MPNVLVRDVDAKALAKLKARAKRNGRSLGAELRLIVEEAASVVDMETARKEAARIRAKLSGRHHTPAAELLREDRER
jgi:plasmid stability protein